MDRRVVTEVVLRKSILGWGSLFFVVLALSGCVQVDATVPQVCALVSQLSIPALLPSQFDFPSNGGGDARLDFVPRGTASGTIQRDGFESIPQAFDDLGATGGIQLLFVEVTAQSGVRDFSFIEEISIEMSGVGSSTLQPALLAACDVSMGCDVSGQILNLNGTGEDLLPYLREGTLEFRVEATGTLPLREWSVNIDLCMTVSGQIQAGL